MSDQADILRHLVAGALRGPGPAAPNAPPLIAVSGAKGGVGATTVALNLAIALADQQQRVLLADVDFCRADVALYCGLHARQTTSDVLSGRCEVHETLINGPGGIRIAPGAWAAPTSMAARPAAQRRLIDQLRGFHEQADFVLLDLGCDTSEAAQRYWQAADCVLLVTTGDSVAVMDAYAAVKVAGANCVDPRIIVVVNQLQAEQDAADVHWRIDRSCRRFLGFDVAHGGGVPFDRNVPEALRTRTPLQTHAPDCPAAAALGEIANSLRQMVAQRDPLLAGA